MLGYAWNEADRLAGSFEHDLPQEVEDRIFQALAPARDLPARLPHPRAPDRGHPGHAPALRPRAGRRGRGGGAGLDRPAGAWPSSTRSGCAPACIVEVKEKHPFDGPLVAAWSTARTARSSAQVANQVFVRKK